MRSDTDLQQCLAEGVCEDRFCDTSGTWRRCFGRAVIAGFGEEESECFDPDGDAIGERAWLVGGRVSEQTHEGSAFPFFEQLPERFCPCPRRFRCSVRLLGVRFGRTSRFAELHHWPGIGFLDGGACEMVVHDHEGAMHECCDGLDSEFFFAGEVIVEAALSKPCAFQDHLRACRRVSAFRQEFAHRGDELLLRVVAWSAHWSCHTNQRSMSLDNYIRTGTNPRLQDA